MHVSCIYPNEMCDPAVYEWRRAWLYVWNYGFDEYIGYVFEASFGITF